MKSPVVSEWTELITKALNSCFADKDPASHPLDHSMEYSILAGGKRVRPLLVLMACEAAGQDPLPFIEISLAPELLHTYSLIHDDLPCMDDDDLRRGKPTSHKVFGEALAILSGDGLHSVAFEYLASKGPSSLPPEIRLALIKEFCEAIGHHGMVAGQVMDLQAEKSPITLDQLFLLHARKTGALIRFCARMGGLLAQASPEDLSSLTLFSERLGLLFQVVDDILDRRATAEELGKTPGKDLSHDKATFPKLLGMNGTETLADELMQECLDILARSKLKKERLRDLVIFVRKRAS